MRRSSPHSRSTCLAICTDDARHRTRPTVSASAAGLPVAGVGDRPARSAITAVNGRGVASPARMVDGESGQHRLRVVGLQAPDHRRHQDLARGVRDRVADCARASRPARSAGARAAESWSSGTAQRRVEIRRRQRVGAGGLPARRRPPGRTGRRRAAGTPGAASRSAVDGCAAVAVGAAQSAAAIATVVPCAPSRSTTRSFSGPSPTSVAPAGRRYAQDLLDEVGGAVDGERAEAGDRRRAAGRRGRPARTGSGHAHAAGQGAQSGQPRATPRPVRCRGGWRCPTRRASRKRCSRPSSR